MILVWEYEYMCYTALLDCGIPKSEVLAFKNDGDKR